MFQPFKPFGFSSWVIAWVLSFWVTTWHNIILKLYVYYSIVISVSGELYYFLTTLECTLIMQTFSSSGSVILFKGFQLWFCNIIHKFPALEVLDCSWVANRVSTVFAKFIRTANRWYFFQTVFAPYHLPLIAVNCGKKGFFTVYH